MAIKGMIKRIAVLSLILLYVIFPFVGAQSAAAQSSVAQSAQGGDGSGDKNTEYNKLLKWHNRINVYIDTIEKFMTAYNKALQAKTTSAGGSLLPAQKHIETMKSCQSRLGSFAPDSLFSNGHRYLISSFDNFKNSLIFPTGSSQQQEFLSRAQSDYSKAQMEFNNYLDAYNKELENYSQP